MIEIRDLHVRKGDRTICSINNLTVERGERVAIIGPNGSGKTTLLRVLAGLERNFSGQCQVEVALLDRVFVHQSPWLFRGTVATNVGYGPAARGRSRRERTGLAQEWLERFGIVDLCDSRADKLSGGEVRRTALARAFVLRPKLLLLDEPLGDLDDRGSELLLKALEADPTATVVMTSPIAMPEGFASRTTRITGRSVLAAKESLEFGDRDPITL